MIPANLLSCSAKPKWRPSVTRQHSAKAIGATCLNCRGPELSWSNRSDFRSIGGFLGCSDRAARLSEFCKNQAQNSLNTARYARLWRRRESNLKASLILKNLLNPVSRTNRETLGLLKIHAHNAHTVFQCESANEDLSVQERRVSILGLDQVSAERFRVHATLP
jgi:hypothetical protein